MLIRSKRIWIANNFIPAIIEVEDKKIKRILEYDKDMKVDYDFENNRIVPGFIDIHTHGAVNVEANVSSLEEIHKWADYLPSEGVTAFCPTTVTQTEEVLKKASKTILEAKESQKSGAKILGINFEGPFLDVNYKGAQPQDCIVEPDLEKFSRFQSACKDLILIMTVAVEKDKDYALTRQLSSKGVVVSVGHSGATYDEAMLGIANGAKLLTHTFNGMTGLHHRNPGQVGAALRIRDVYSEIICDGIHIRPEVINIFFMSKGPDYAVMVSDSMSAKAFKGTDFYLGGERVIVSEDGSARRESGALAGSILKIIDGLKVVVESAQVPFNYAINACTSNPARLLRIDDRKGYIKANYDADLVAITDDYKIINTMVEGEFQI